MSWLYRLFKRDVDVTSITLDPSVTGGLIVPAITLSANSTGLRTVQSAVTVSATGAYIPTQVYLSVAADAGSTVGAGYFKVVTAAAMTGQIATLMVRTGIYHNVFDAYGLMSHIVFDAATVATTDANAHLTALSAKVTFAGGTVSKGWVTAGLFIVEGAGTCSQLCYGVSIVVEAGSTGCQALLHLNDDVGTTPYFKFSGADGTGKSIYTHTAAGTQHGTIAVLINGTAKWLPFMAAE
jgi:hypothetical protein